MNSFLLNSNFTNFRYKLLKILKEEKFSKFKTSNDLKNGINLVSDLKLILQDINKYLPMYEAIMLKNILELEDFEQFKIEVETELSELDDKPTKHHYILESLNEIQKNKILKQNAINLNISASIMSLQHSKGINRANQFFRSKLLNSQKEESYSSEKEKLEVYLYTQTNFYNCFNNLYKELEQKYNIQLFDFEYQKIIDFVDTIQNIKQKHGYLTKILFIFKNHIDELTLSLINHYKMMFDEETGTSLSFDEFCAEQIELDPFYDIKQSALHKESFHMCIEGKIQLYNDLLNTGIEEIVLPKKRNSDIRFKWNGDEIGLIELIHLLLATETLTYEYTKSNGLDKGLQAAYKDIFEYFNVIPPDDPSKKVSDIKKRETKILSKKIGGQSTNYHHIFHFVHKLFVNYLKRN